MMMYRGHRRRKRAIGRATYGPRPADLRCMALDGAPDDPTERSTGVVRMGDPPGTLDEDADLRAVLASVDPSGRDALRRVLIRDQVDRDEIATQLLRYLDAVGVELAGTIDMLTMHREERRKVVRLLAEIEARSGR